MAGAFDATLKHLFEAYAEDWLRLLRIPAGGPATLLDADLATVSAAADKVLRLEAPEPWLLHIELQASYDPRLGRRMLRYNVLLDERHRLAVRSVAVLLRPSADGPQLTGSEEREAPGRGPHLRFEYEVLRLWQVPVSDVLAAGIGALPIAPLAAVEPDRLPEVVRRMDERLKRETSPEEAASIWTATYVLMGLRYPADLVNRVAQEVRTMRESSTYQYILEEGRVEGRLEGRAEGRAEALAALREVLLVNGEKRFGAPAGPVRAAIEGMADLQQLKMLSERVLDVETWDELLAES